MNPMLEFRSVERRFKDGDNLVFALRDTSFSIEPGEFVAVMGASGSGKSTLLNLAGGLDVPTAGHVLVNGNDLSSLSVTELADVRRTQVGYVFQRLNLVPSLNVVENVMLPLELDGVSARQARTMARQALGEAGIAELVDRFPDDISGGQQQRVAIARAIVGDRQLILADEPTGALDTVTGEGVLALLAKQVAGGRTVVLVTHEPRYASYADRVLTVRDGMVSENAGRVVTLARSEDDGMNDSDELEGVS
jgi:putative ABC transport system ATP-binding protein